MSGNKRRRSNNQDQSDSIKNKLATKSDIEKLICKRKLDALDLEESQSKDDRLSYPEKQKLLEAFEDHGFRVFQDMKLLHQYLPLRRESDLKGLLGRLETSLQPKCSQETVTSSGLLDDWQKLCQKLMGSYAKDRKVNFDHALSDSLLAEVEGMSNANSSSTESTRGDEPGDDDFKPNYPKLLKSFAQLLKGEHPGVMDAADSAMLNHLFEHLNSVIDSLDSQTVFSSLEDGSWLEASMANKRQSQEMALEALASFDYKLTGGPTIHDFKMSPNLRALCLELPKISRITNVLNPLNIDESIMNSLMKLL